MADMTTKPKVTKLRFASRSLDHPRESCGDAAGSRPYSFVSPVMADAAGVAIAILDGDGYITFQNETCTHVLARSTSALFVLNGELRARRRSDLHKLKSALDIATRDNKPSAFRVHNLDDEKSLEILISSLPAGPNSAPLIALIIRSPSDISPDPELLSQLYGLTPAEAGLAEVLIRGEGLAKACEARGISVNTGKGYLKRIFQKTGRRGEISSEDGA